jgi:hypothetical protein
MYQLVTYSMTGYMGTVTAGRSSRAWEKVHNQGYLLVKTKAVEILSTVIAPVRYW